MSLHFVLDEDTPIALAEALRQRGDDAVHARHVGLLGKPGEAVLAFARQEQRILITRDLGFGDTRVHPPGTYPGIVLLRVPTTYVTRQIVDLVLRFLGQVEESALRERLVVLRPTGYRIRSKAPDQA
jgi:predicted nuclease of predicted toxin-antitoxin system